MVTNLSRRLFICLALALLVTSARKASAQGNETYMEVIQGQIAQNTIPPYSASQIVVWPEASALSIPIFFYAWIDSTPVYLSPSLSQSQVMTAAGIWSSSSNNTFVFQQVSSPGIYVAFSQDGQYFPPGQDIAGMTYEAITYSNSASRDIFVVSTNNPETATTNELVVFNNMTNIPWLWTNDTVNVPSGYICFEQVALHELGHVVGLGDDGAATGIVDQGSVMGPDTTGTDFRGLNSDDQSALTTVADQTLTGIGGGGSSGPPAPTGFSATIIGQNVVLSWDPDPIGAQATYSVTRYYNGVYTVITPANYSSTSFVDQGAVSNLPPANNPFYYSVTATNSYGSNSTQSISVSQAPSSVNFSPWSGVFYANGSIIIPSGFSLTISAGTKVIFNSGSGIGFTANGQLNVEGLRYAPVTFTSSSSSPTPGDWGSIVLSGSGANGSTIDYADIDYGTEVDVSSANNVTIENSNIMNSSSYGINVTSSSGFLAQGDSIGNTNSFHGIIITGGSNNNCYQNIIWKTNHLYTDGGAGILYSGSSGYVWQNDIDCYYWGFGAIWGASPYWENPNSNGGRNNRVTNCGYGAMVYQNSFPDLGDPYPPFGVSSIYGNNVDVSFNMSGNTTGSIDAVDVYWNGGNVNNAVLQVGSGSTLYTNPYYSTDLWSGTPLPASEKANGGVRLLNATEKISSAEGQGTTLNAPQPLPPPNDSLHVGMQMRAEGNLTEAKNYFISYIQAHPDDPAGYVELYGCINDTTLSDVFNFFRAAPPNAPAIQMLLLGNLYQMEYQPALAEGVNSRIVADYPNTPIAVKAEMNNMLIDLHSNNDPLGAEALLATIETQASLVDPMEIQDAKEELATYVDPKTGKMPFLGSNQQSAISSQQIQNDLLQNYPNPFNPTTEIMFDVPRSGFVSLKVYDVLGREVKTLAYGYKSAGIHVAQFNGNNLASGVYFYRLTAPGVSQVKKMLLIK